MRRRDFIKSGIGALATTSCAGINQLAIPSGENISPQEMNAFLNGLDGAMNRSVSDPGSGQYIRNLDHCPLAENDATLFRQAMRSLLMIGNFGDLPVAGQVHPGMQQRLKYSAPEMDKAFNELISRTKKLDQTDFEYIKSTLREDPGRADKILEAIEKEAANVSVPYRRRMQLRVMGKKILSRLNHSPELLVDEYMTKSNKILAQASTINHTEYLFKSRLGEEGFNKKIKEIESAIQYWDKMAVTPDNIGYDLLLEQEKQEEEEEGSCDKTLNALGVGAIITAAGWALIGIGSAAEVDFLMWIGVVAGVTVGPIVILISLILLLFC